MENNEVQRKSEYLLSSGFSDFPPNNHKGGKKLKSFLEVQRKNDL